MAFDISQKYLEHILFTRFGFQKFRPGQFEAITKLLKSRCLLCIHPTGFGKSLLYQLPSTLFPGMTVVISPLLALIRDQMDHLNHRFNIPAATLNSDQTEEENENARALVMMKKIKILFVAPEQLDHVDRYEFLLNLPISLVVVDEAHCISTWGHDFRPSYRQIVRYTKELQQKNSNVYRTDAENQPLSGIHVLGLTATADARTEEDIKQQLGSFRPLQILREKMDRPNIALSVMIATSLPKKLAICVKLVRQLSGHGIIYCATRDNTGIVADFLREQGIQAVAYHAGLAPEKKRALQVDFIQDKYKILAATNALGMGIDKQNLRFIIHFDIPGSITAYYQEVGRCGRDGKPAQGILLYDQADERIQEHFIKSAQPKPEDFTKILEVISHESKPLKLIEIKRAAGLHPTLVLVTIAELHEQGFVEKRAQMGSQVYLHTHKSGTVDLSRYDRQYAVKTRELREMISYANQRTKCRMEVLRQALGDQKTDSCGHCCLCQKSTFELAENSNTLKEISSWLEKRVVEIPESKLSRMSSGIALLDGKLRSPSFVHFMKNRAKTSVECFGLPEEFISFLKDQIERLAQKRTISAIIPIPSLTWEARNGIATLIANHLGVPAYMDLLYWKEPPPFRQGELKNNDQRKHNVKGRMTARAIAPLSLEGVLLLDDYIGSGATMKEGARALRKEGRFSGEIVSFTIAQVRWKLGSSGMI